MDHKLQLSSEVVQKGRKKEDEVEREYIRNKTYWKEYKG